MSVCCSQLAYRVLNMSISLTEDEIRALADEINRIIRGLGNIDQILSDTRADLEKANALKERADNTKLVAGCQAVLSN